MKQQKPMTNMTQINKSHYIWGSMCVCAHTQECMCFNRALLFPPTFLYQGAAFRVDSIVILKNCRQGELGLTKGMYRLVLQLV